MAEERDQERNLPATPKRLEQAREQGQVARSRELATCLVLLGAAGAIWWTAPTVAARFQGLMRAGLTLDGRSAFVPDTMAERLSALSLDAILVVLPILGVLLAASLLAPLALGGWVFTLNPIVPAFSRLSLLAGLGRMFSVQGLIELVKAIAKALLVGGVGAWLIWRSIDPMIALAEAAPLESMTHFSQLMLWAFLILAAALLVVAAIDVPYQLYHHHSNLRMTLQEVKREARESEGDPQLKARVRERAREISRRRMMSQVPKADVVVTNPTHYAVALKYVDGRMGAPKVVAKGADLLAARIRAVAQEHEVPVFEAPPLARALYRNVELEQPIPNALYAAVAQVLAYVYQLRNWRRFGGNAPIAPVDLPVPAELDMQGASA